MTYNMHRYFLKILVLDFIGSGNYRLKEKLLTKPTLIP
jgi:hypothetical protein